MIEHKTVLINNIKIDKILTPIIKEFWLLGGRSYQCCQGGRISKEDFEMVNDNDYQFYSKDNDHHLNYYECAWIIIDIKDIELLISILKPRYREVHIIFRSNGYNLNEYTDDIINYDNVCTVLWRRI